MGNAELVGSDDVITEDLVEAVADGILEIRGGSEKEGHVQMVKYRGENERNK